MLINCSICLGDVNLFNKEVSITKCGHFFHSHCLNNWLYQQMNCPECRAIVTGDNFVRSIFPKVNEETASQLKHLEDKCSELRTEVLWKEEQCDSLQKINQKTCNQLKYLKDKCESLQSEVLRKQEECEELRDENLLLKMWNSALTESKLIV